VSGHFILVVDDDEIFRKRMSRALSERGLEVRSAANVDEALALAANEPPELAVVDLRMPGRSGLELVRALKELDPATRVLVLTGYGSIATAVDAMRLGATNYLPKPADADDVLSALFPEGVPGRSSGGEEPTAPTLARAEWEHIHRIMADCDGNLSEAARRLGVHRRSLQRKLQKYPPRQ
jgi:two-component system response regulator RegA